MKKKIFISHRYYDGENNYFAFWLALKLRQCGYDVWVDIDGLRGGELWNKVVNIIKNETVRFIACISESYIEQSKNEKSGVFKELSAADTVKDIPGFIIPVKFDNSRWEDVPPQCLGFMGEPFDNNWSDGLRKLIEILEEVNVPKISDESDLKNFWYEALKIDPHPVEKAELYYTNWYEIEKPELVHMHALYQNQFENLPDSIACVRDKNILVSFFDRDYLSEFVNVAQTRSMGFDEFIRTSRDKNYHNFAGKELIEPRKKTIDLLRRTVEGFFLQREYFTYKYSNSLGFFSNKIKNNISLKHIGKTRKALSGSTMGLNWFFGLDFNFALSPVPHIKASSRVIFKDSDGNFVDKDTQHRERKRYCSTWYNRDWLELQLAFFSEAANSQEVLHIPITSKDSLKVKSMPISLESNVGYNEPNKEDETDSH